MKRSKLLASSSLLAAAMTRGVRALVIGDDVLEAAKALDAKLPKVKAHESRAPAGAGNEVMIYGVVGDPYDQLDAKSFMDRVKGMGEISALTVRINSGGGYLFDGLAIYNFLSELKAEVTVVVDGIAASMASVIAMAGDNIVIPENAMLMIHDPWNVAIGNADELRREAAFLDKCKDSLISIYADATGLARADIGAMMTAETWLNGAEAVEKGFATETGAAVEAAALLRPSLNHLNLKNLPGALLRETRRALAATPPAQPKESTMDRTALLALAAALGLTVTAAVDKVIEDLIAGKADMTKAINELTKLKPAGSTLPSAAEIEAKVQAAIAAERTRVADIQAAVKNAKLKPEVADQLIKDGVSIEQARAKIIDAMADASNALPETHGHVRIQVGQEARDKFRTGVQAAIMARSTIFGTIDLKGNEFRGLTMAEIARAALESVGIKTQGMDRMKMVKAAITESTSDFPYILENIANKAMMKGYDDAQETFQKWTSPGTLTDFKTASRVDLTAFPSLATVNQGAEYTYAYVGDRKEPITLATYGNLFSITRQAIINDDLSSFTRMPQKMGRAAIRTIGDLVYAVLTTNPNMNDGVALFNSAHNNLSGTSDAITAASVDAGRVGMATQKDRKQSKINLNLRPKYGLCPIAKGGIFRQLVASTYDPAKTTFVPNPVQNLVEVIDDARLDTASTVTWYLAADPAVTDTIEVAYLDGVQTPTLEQMEAWKNDGIEFKIRIDAAVKAIAWEGLWKNPGA